MLKRLRLQLTLLYILAALSLVVLAGAGAYAILKYYFLRETDLALQYKMALQFRQYGLTPPQELLQAEQSWQANNTRQPSAANPALPTLTPLPPTQTATLTSLPARQESGSEDEDEAEEGEAEAPDQVQPASSIDTASPAATLQPAAAQSTSAEQEDGEGSEDNEERYDGQLASIYTIPSDASGNIITAPSLSQPPFSLDEEASRAALVNGHDLRTISLSNGTRLRLLTYQLTTSSGPLVLQMGRTLVDQDRILKQFLIGLILLGSASSILLGLGSWWLSGRSLSPAQKAWDQQQAFVSNASHELRTPLTLIHASAEVGLRSQPQGEQESILQDILDESDYMNRLVDDLLLLSRLDSHRLKLGREPVSLSELLQDIASQAEKLVAGKAIRIELGRLQGTVWGDRARLRQVLLILLDNAIRFTPPGGAIRIETFPQRRTMQILVSDTGRGIPPQHLPHIFERFYQVASSTEPTRSSGLGLSIAKAMIEAQGGKISIESQVGMGTRVILELPSLPSFPSS
jgi:signal transduction histidine kinase